MDNIKVLVWDSYGKINVYRLDTPNRCVKILNDIQDSLKYWEDDFKEFSDKLERYTKKYPPASNIMLKMSGILQEMHDLGIIGSHETFQKMEITFLI